MITDLHLSPVQVFRSHRQHQASRLFERLRNIPYKARQLSTDFIAQQSHLTKYIVIVFGLRTTIPLKSGTTPDYSVNRLHSVIAET